MERLAEEGFPTIEAPEIRFEGIEIWISARIEDYMREKRILTTRTIIIILKLDKISHIHGTYAPGLTYENYEEHLNFIQKDMSKIMKSS